MNKEPSSGDPQTSKYRRTRLFVLTLGYSGKCARVLVSGRGTSLVTSLHGQCAQTRRAR